LVIETSLYYDARSEKHHSCYFRLTGRLRVYDTAAGELGDRLC